MSALTDYTDSVTTKAQFGTRYKAVGSPVWAADIDRAMKRAIAAIDDGTVGSKDAKAQILDDWADGIKLIAAQIHSGTPS